MASTPLHIVEEWRRKGFEFASESDDLFSSVFTKVFDVVAVILKESDYRRIKHALSSLDFELYNALSYETNNEPTIRSFMYGTIQAFHSAIVHLMGKLGQNTVDQSPQTNEGAIRVIAPTHSPMLMVEEWRKKCFEFFNQSDDLFSSVVTRGLEVVSAILKDADHRRIKHALSSLAFERCNSLSYENDKEPSIRSMMYGTMEVFHLAIVHLMEKMDENTVCQLSAGPNAGMRMVLNGEDTMAENMIPGKKASHHTIKKEIKEEEMRIDEELMAPLPMMNELPRRVEVKTEIFDDGDFAFDAYNGMNASNELEEFENEGMGRHSRRPEMVWLDSDEDEGPSRKKSKSASEKRSGKVVKRKPRIVAKLKRFVEPEEYSDEDERPPFKKSKSRAIEKKGMNLKAMPVKRTSKETELACPECKFRTTDVHTWLRHLEKIHATSPALAGLLLRCDCGFEIAGSLNSLQHESTCDVIHFTVVRKRKGPVRRFNDTLKCILCEKYPKTIKAYSVHLFSQHKSSLLQKGIKLKCACGFIFTSTFSSKSHNKECDGNEFTLHNIEDE